MFHDHLLKSDSILICRPTGRLDDALALEVIEGIESREAAADDSFDRFIDMTEIGGIALDVSDVRRLARRRREFNPSSGVVKAAFLADSPLAFATARMYEMLLRSERIKARVFDELEDAAEWLEIDADKLRSAPAPR